MEKRKKRRRLLIGVSFGIVIAIIIILTLNQQRWFNSLDVEFISTPVIEYGEKEIDLKKYVQTCNGEIVGISEVNTMEIGEQEIVLTLSDGTYSKEVKKVIEVKDTKAPEIELEKESVEIEEGEEYDPKSNVVSVTDLVDGNIEEYTIEGEYDVNTAGEYTITVIAKDKNDNETKKEFTLAVKEKEVETFIENTKPNENDINSTPNKPIGNTEGNNTNTPVPAPTPQPEQKPEEPCVPKYAIYNSGKIFQTYEEAIQWADEQQFNESSSWYMMTYLVAEFEDGCGGNYSTVEFY